MTGGRRWRGALLLSGKFGGFAMIHPVVIIISIFAVIIVSALGTALIRRRIFTRTYGALMTRDYPAFFREVDSKGMMSMFPEYVRDNLKLTAYMEMKDSGKVTETFNRMMKDGADDARKGDLLVRGFQYFSGEKDRKKVRKILEKMEQVMDRDISEKYRRHYEILFERSGKYITELEKEVPLHQNRMKGYLQFLLARSYRNAGREKECLPLLKQAAAEYHVTAGELESVVRVL